MHNAQFETESFKYFAQIPLSKLRHHLRYKTDKHTA